jgi:hypothetical protein
VSEQPDDHTDDQTADEPVDQQLDEPADQQLDEPADQQLDEPADQQLDEPAREQPGPPDDGALVTDDRIAAAVARLDALDERPPAEHVEVYEEVHAVLQESLAQAQGDQRHQAPGGAGQ